MLSLSERLKCAFQIALLRAAGFLFPLAKKSYRESGITLQLPISHELPIYRKFFPHYAINLTRIVKGVAHKYPNLSAVDVGANLGDSVVFIRLADSSFPVLCVEGSDEYFEGLQHNAQRLGQCVCVKAFLGERTTTAKLNLVATRGTGQLLPGEDTISIQTLDDIINEHPTFTSSKILKVDTDGFDNSILRGAKEFLQRSKPVIFFEYIPDLLKKNGENGVAIFSFLRGIGYEKIVFYTNTGEFLISGELANEQQLQELDLYYTGKGTTEYLDICVFHSEDADIFEEFLRKEIQYFSAHSVKNRRIQHPPPP